MQRNTKHNEDPKEKALRLLREAEEQRANKRFERGLSEFNSDRLEILNNPEFRGKIALYLYDNFTHEKCDESKELFDKFFYLLDKRIAEENIHQILDNVGLHCQKGYNLRLIQYLCSRYREILDKSDSTTKVSDGLSDFLGHTCGLFVRSSRWKDFESLVHLLWKIKDLTFQTSDGKKKPFNNVFSHVASKDVIEKILQYHNSGAEEEKVFASKCMRYFGEDALLFLLNRLVFSKTKEERFLLIDLISSIGEDIVGSIQKFMELNLPWYAVRNLIILIAELGNSDYYPMVEGYLVHPDTRVQQQVVACIVKLGGGHLHKRLMQALPVVDDEIKLKLVMQLGVYEDEEIANGLIDIIHKRENFSEAIREELLYRICISLRSYPYTKVTNLLKHLLKEKTESSREKSRLTIAIQETINILEPQIRHLVKEKQAAPEEVNFDLLSDPEENEQVTAEDFLEDIEDLLQAGNLEKATALMYKKIIDSARSKEFHTAEVLRDKLLEINPDALQDVIRAAEIIEEEKNSPTTSVRLEIWNDLFQLLNSDEYDALYSLLRTEEYRKDEKIVSAGEIDPCLYFLNTGAVRLSCICGQHETFLKRLKPGDVLGVGPFFSASVWTVNLIALQKTTLQVLRRSDFQKIEKQVPDLEEKLQGFVTRKEIVPELIKMSGRDRRDCARYPVNVTVNNILLDPYGGSSGRRVFQGEMIDISRGGLSFSIRITKRENAHLLLGRQIISEIKVKGDDVLKCFGLIVGVKYQHEIVKEFSVHVKFYNELEQNQVASVVNVHV